MPIISVSTDDMNLDRADQYTSPIPAGLIDYDEVAVQALRDRRRQFAMDEQELVSIQKNLRGSETKELKKIIQHFQRIQKMTTRVLQWIEGETTDLRFRGWPIELSEYADEAFMYYYVRMRNWLEPQESLPVQKRRSHILHLVGGNDSLRRVTFSNC